MYMYNYDMWYDLIGYMGSGNLGGSMTSSYTMIRGSMSKVGFFSSF